MFGWFRKRTPMEKAAIALAGVRRDSAWLSKRPFSDQFDGDDLIGQTSMDVGLGSGGRSGRHEQPVELKPVPPHPRSTARPAN